MSEDRREHHAVRIRNPDDQTREIEDQSGLLEDRGEFLGFLCTPETRAEVSEGRHVDVLGLGQRWQRRREHLLATPRSHRFRIGKRGRWLRLPIWGRRWWNGWRRR